MAGIEDMKSPMEEPEEGAPIWMITFADMMTLLMAFFVMLLSFANMDIQKFKKLMGSVHQSFGAGRTDPGRSGLSTEDAYDAMLRRAEERLNPGRSNQIVPPLVPGQSGREGGFSQASQVIQSVFGDVGVEGVEVTPVKGGVMVRVPGGVLFDSGSAEVKETGMPLIILASKLMNKYKFDLYINGHTDSVPVAGGKYPSNWELSSARAAAALRLLVERGADPGRLVAVGYADSRPVADNQSFEGRQKNRRIEFVFKNPEQADGGAGLKPATP